MSASAHNRPVTWVALLRGINVGGNNLLPMKDLAALLTSAGFADVKTYFQSGNVVFRGSVARASAVSKRISTAIAERRGIEPRVLVLGPRDLQRAAAANPFPDAAADPKSLHLFFLCESPRAPDLDSLARLKSRSEEFALAGSVFYLHAPDGIARSRLAQNVDRFLGVPTTARNWRTVCALLQMAIYDC